jgi:hypothetical protein
MISMLILALLMVGILQMFSMSLLVAQGSGARTQLTYKAQQVVEQIRYVQYLRRSSKTAAASDISSKSGIPVDLGSVTSSGIQIPYDGSGTQWAFWGPSGANVMESANGPYRLSYTVADGGTLWIVTVTAVAQGASTTGTRLYLGTATGNKRIDYVAEISKL